MLAGKVGEGMRKPNPKIIPMQHILSVLLTGASAGHSGKLSSIIKLKHLQVAQNVAKTDRPSVSGLLKAMGRIFLGMEGSRVRV